MSDSPAVWIRPCFAVHYIKTIQPIFQHNYNCKEIFMYSLWCISFFTSYTFLSLTGVLLRKWPNKPLPHSQRPHDLTGAVWHHSTDIWERRMCTGEYGASHFVWKTNANCTWTKVQQQPDDFICLRKLSSACAQHVANMMLRMKREFAGSQNQILPVFDTLLLLDRNVDLLTPLATQLTYEGLIDEIYGITNGRN